ncbi:hypothetical protein BKA62DRAFT_766186 [Auriculariales sp. MPI-PUGE-AT-0066]|nr:hypothetical protein BKA62DRAFT_766186 [Auriculariales sp. MPI-PUGE-AT-0066]
MDRGFRAETSNEDGEAGDGRRMCPNSPSSSTHLTLLPPTTLIYPVTHSFVDDNPQLLYTMKFLALFAAFITFAVAAPVLEDQPLEARDTVAFAARDEYCNVPSAPDTWVIDTVYKIVSAVVSALVYVASRCIAPTVRCMTQRGLALEQVAVFETMRVESNFHNLDCGDKDSLGVFQQRPSVQAWGNRDQILNVPHAANAFIDAMLQCSRSNPSSSPGQIAQCAQISEIPDAYDQAEGEARRQLSLAIQRNGKSSSGSGGAVNVGSVNSSSGGSSGGGCAKSVTAKRAGKSYCVKKGSSSSSNAKPKCKKWYKTKKVSEFDADVVEDRGVVENVFVHGKDKVERRCY